MQVESVMVRAEWYMNCGRSNILIKYFLNFISHFLYSSDSVDQYLKAPCCQFGGSALTNTHC